MTKKILTIVHVILWVVVLNAVASGGEKNALIPPPLSLSALKPNHQENVKTMSALYANGDFHLLYKHAKKVHEEFSLELRSGIIKRYSPDFFRYYAWLRYYVIGAPFFSVTLNPDVPFSSKNNDDYWTKYEFVPVDFSLIMRSALPEKEKVALREWSLLCLYKFLKDTRAIFKELPHKHEIVELERTARERVKSLPLPKKAIEAQNLFMAGLDTLLGSFAEGAPSPLDQRLQNYVRQVEALKSRHILLCCKNELFEDSLLRGAIEVYPTKANTIKKLFHDAGYEDADILTILNRTLGRTPKTAFLYKALPQHKMKQ